MSDNAPNTRREWLPFQVANGRFGDNVAFNDDGSVRLGDRAYADGCRISVAFAGNSAFRENQFGAILTIATPDKQTYQFRYDGTAWFRLVEHSDAPLPWLHALRKEMAESGVVIGAIAWLFFNLSKWIVIGGIIFVLVIILLVDWALSRWWRSYDPGNVSPILYCAAVAYVPLSFVMLREVVREQRRNRAKRLDDRGLTENARQDPVARWMARSGRTLLRWFDQKIFYD